MLSRIIDHQLGRPRPTRGVSLVPPGERHAASPEIPLCVCGGEEEYYDEEVEYNNNMRQKAIIPASPPSLKVFTFERESERDFL